MKAFLTKIAVFAGIFVGILFLGMAVTRVTFPQDLHYALPDKHRLLEETKSPRIVLMGGSNLGFGVMSHRMKEALGVNVINTSLHAGMGMKYIIEDILPYLKEGDVVVYVPEYSQFFGDTLWGNEPMVSSIVAVPSNVRLFNKENWRTLIGTVSKRSIENLAKFGASVARGLLGIEKHGVYSRDSFNDLGDVVAHYGKPRVPFSNTTSIPGDFNETAIEQIRDLAKVVEEKNGTLLLSYSCLNRGSFVHVRDRIALVERRYKKEGFRVLGTPERYSLPDYLYYNTTVHLTREGAEERTRLLIADLAKSGAAPSHK